MKIAVFHNLPSGGAKRALYESVKRLSVDNIIDLYGYSSRSEKYLDIRPFCGNVYFLRENINRSSENKIFSKISLFFIVFLLSRRIAKEIDSKEYDVVFVTHDEFIQSPLVMFFLKTKTIYYCHEPLITRNKFNLNNMSLRKFILEIFQIFSNYILKFLDRLSIKSADIVLANSKYSILKIYEVYQINANLVFGGRVNHEKFFYMPEIKKQNMVLSVGRLHESKGHDFVILALSLIKESLRPTLRIMCDASDNNYKKYLFSLAKENKVSVLIETIPEKDTCKIYNQSLFTIISPINEPCGLVPIESMACKVPTIGVSEGGIKESIINNKTGFLVARREDLFAKKIQQLLIDGPLREEFGLMGITHSKSFNWDDYAEEIFDNLKLS